MPKLPLLVVVFALPFLVSANTAGTIRVTAAQDGEQITALSEDGATVVKQIEYIGLESWSKPVTTEIRFAGEAATPLATIMVTIPDAKVSQSATVTDAGSWDMTVSTAQLTAGSYYAYVAVAEGDTFSNSIPVAYFTVLDDQSLSWQTWIFLGTSFVTIIALLSAITLQLGYNSKYHTVL